MIPTTMLEKLLFTTVRITTVGADGSHGLGTGFFFSRETGAGVTNVYLVTNKHVIAGAERATLHLIAAKGDQPDLGAEISFELQSPQQSFIGHPDPQVDIAVTGIGGILGRLQAAGTPAFVSAVPAEMSATTETLASFEPIEPVTFVGYPNGLYDSGSLLPIVRRGHSATALDVDYENKPIFLVDASVFPGSSGSPVFLIVPPSTPDKDGNIVLGGKSRSLFLGVVAAVYQRQVQVLTTATSAPFVNDTLDIGVVYKASALMEMTKSH